MNEFWTWLGTMEGAIIWCFGSLIAAIAFAVVMDLLEG